MKTPQQPGSELDEVAPMALLRRGEIDRNCRAVVYGVPG